MKKYIEYAVHSDECGVDFLKGGEWRKALQLVKECEEGKHPEVIFIERVIRTIDEYGLEDDRIEITLYDSEVDV